MIHIHRASYLFALCATMLTLCTPVDVRGQNNDLANFFYRAWAHGAQQAHERYLHESMLAQNFFLHILQQQHEREMRQAEIRSTRLSAYEGNPGSQYLLGLMYLKGEEGSPQYAHAIRWLRQSADQGWADAQVTLGLIYRSGAGVEKNFSESFKWFQMAAADPYHAEAQFYLGLSCLSYVLGEDVLPNFGEGCRLAPELIRKSAELGYADAQVILGHMYRSGSGVGEDLSEAVKWFKLAADQYHPEAQFYLVYLSMEYDLGEVATPNGEFAMVSLENRFGDRTHASAQFLLSLAHRFAEGVVSDNKLAFELIKKAAELDYAPAYHYTGWGYFNGIGTRINVEEGVRWLLKEPDLCIEFDTCVYLGLTYVRGVGVKPNTSQALEWFAKAQDQDEASRVMFELGEYYEKDNTQKSHVWFYLAGRLEHPKGATKADEMLDSVCPKIQNIANICRLESV